jgi:conserved hypothetical protein TIGR00046
MSSPVFYQEFSPEESQPSLSESLAHHLLHVLRMKPGNEIQLANGKGHVLHIRISSVSKKELSYEVLNSVFYEPPAYDLHLAVAFTKQSARNEWLLEKVTEIGVTTIIPLITERSEKVFVKKERYEKILQSAMQQSKQVYLPTIHQPTPVLELSMENFDVKCIAWCDEHAEKKPIRTLLQKHKKTLIMIGPEGDFTAEEVSLCLSKGCEPVSMGATRLRTETAAVVACSIFHSL